MAQLEKTVELLRGERDRFVAFSFASADILIELDENGRILFVDGAISGLLGRKGEDLLGEAFTTLIHADDASHASNLLEVALKEGRVDHEKLNLSSKFGDPVPFALSGYKLGALKNHYYLTLTFLKEQISPQDIERRDQGTGLFRKEIFASTATKKIRTAQEQGKKVQIALVDLPELRELLDHMEQDAAHSLIYDISEYLRHASLGGDTAGMSDTGSYSLILDASVNPDRSSECSPPRTAFDSSTLLAHSNACASLSVPVIDRRDGRRPAFRRRGTLRHRPEGGWSSLPAALCHRAHRHRQYGGHRRQP